MISYSSDAFLQRGQTPSKMKDSQTHRHLLKAMQNKSAQTRRDTHNRFRPEGQLENILKLMPAIDLVHVAKLSEFSKLRSKANGSVQIGSRGWTSRVAPARGRLTPRTATA